MQDLDALLASDATNKATLALRARLIDAFAGAARASGSAADFDTVATAIKDQAKTLGGDPAYAKLAAELADVRVKVAQAEQVATLGPRSL